MWGVAGGPGRPKAGQRAAQFQVAGGRGLCGSERSERQTDGQGGSVLDAEGASAGRQGPLDASRGS